MTPKDVSQLLPLSALLRDRARADLSRLERARKTLADEAAALRETPPCGLDIDPGVRARRAAWIDARLTALAQQEAQLRAGLEDAAADTRRAVGRHHVLETLARQARG